MCDCIAKVNALLAEHNTMLLEPIFVSPDMPTRLFVETVQIKSGRGLKKACSMFASFCPFCGEKYEAKARTPEAHSREEG